MSNTNLFLDRSIQVSAPKRSSSIRKSLGGKIVNPVSLDAYISNWVANNPTAISGVLPVATTTTQGITELATNLEAIAGVSTTTVVTPAALAAAMATIGDLESVLTNGNSTGANDITVANNQSIVAANGGGSLNLRDGVDGSVGLTNDNGAYNNSYVGLTTTNVTMGLSGTGHYTVESGHLHYNLSVPSFAYMTSIEAGLNAVANIAAANYVLAIADNSLGAISFNSGATGAFSLGSGSPLNPTVFNAGILNSVALGGIGITAKTANTAYTNQLGLNAASSAFEGLVSTLPLTLDQAYVFPDTTGLIRVDYCIATNANIAAIDGNIIFATAGALGITVDLPDPTLYDGQQVVVKKIDNGIGDVGVTTAVGNLEGVALPLAISVQYTGYQFTCYNGNWWITGTF